MLLIYSQVGLDTILNNYLLFIMGKEIEIVIIGFASIDIFNLDSCRSSDSTNKFLAVPGGSSANVAVGLSKLGVKTCLISKLGQDAFGKVLLKTLKKYGVDTKGIKFTEKARTPLVFISKKDKKKVLFYRNPGSDMKLLKRDIKKSCFKNAFLFHFDSVCLTDKPELTAVNQALNYAKENNLIFSFDVNYRKMLWKNKKLAVKRIKEAIRKVDLVKLNTSELFVLFRTKNINAGSGKILEISNKTKMVIITDGKEGSYIRTRKSFKFMRAIDIPVVETTGCGDSFMAAFLSKILEILKMKMRLEDITDEVLEKILLYSNTAGAITSSKEGVIPVLPTKKDVESLLNYKGLSN